ncbi:alpha/beta hydrolase [Rhodococcus sovatensis]|uniref:Alpha/beta hydrolase n=1 Tax=Rhodococcus sovatensis TaxID=1805840 RepID=A0ABZ2PSD1_9NOCA
MSEWASHAVVLPGTGSDAQFAAAAFAPALSSVGTSAVAVEPDPNGVVASYEAALDAAASEHGQIIIGGISIGAAVAVAWASRNPGRACAILAALPPWIGAPGDAPAAASARYTSQRLLDDGLVATTAEMVASTPEWLAETLTRSWRSQWPDLPAALIEASAYTAPDRELLARLRVPTAIVAAVDDPIHPYDVARIWHAEIPGSSLSTVTLADIGTDPGIIGARSVGALSASLGQQDSPNPSSP